MSMLRWSMAARSAVAVRPAGRRLLIAGAVVLAAMLGACCALIVTHLGDGWLTPVDLNVYRLGGEVVLHQRPRYNPAVAAPLYDWPGFGLKFTYPPFAAMAFTIFGLPSWGLLPQLWLAVNVLALGATIWVTLGALGYRAGVARLGGTFLLAAALLWTEPVQRTMYLGQIELVLMALVMWDLCQPDRRWWQGVGVGVAAGIKLVPLIFIPYFLFTGRYRQAGVAAATFAATVIVSFAVMPADSNAWWLRGLLLNSGRTGFTGWEGNQSLQGLITRLAGSIAGGLPVWLVVALVVLVGGVGCAVALARAGQAVLGVLTCALTGLLVSPISWDHHWVWVVPGVTALICYAIRPAGWPRWTWLFAGVLVAGLFGAWPGLLWGEPQDLAGFAEGFIWAPPNTSPGTFARLGDRPWYAEYHWHGIQLLTGNLYVLTGLAMLMAAAGLVVRSAVAHGLGPAAAARDAGTAAADNRAGWLSSR